MTKFSKKAKDKVKKVMHEKKKGTLKCGRSGDKVTSRKQAIAIVLSEARKEGAKVPKKKGAAKKKAAPKKKVAPKKVAPKKAPGKGAPKKAVKKAAVRKVINKKAAAKKTGKRGRPKAR
jgi:hypothetical protein